MIPFWYHETIGEFIIYHCDDMHPKNKVLLLHMLEKLIVESKEKMGWDEGVKFKKLRAIK